MLTIDMATLRRIDAPDREHICIPITPPSADARCAAALEHSSQVLAEQLADSRRECEGLRREVAAQRERIAALEGAAIAASSEAALVWSARLGG